MGKIDHPAYYTHNGLEAIDAIEAWGLNFSLGCVIKYICRAGHKDGANDIEDLKKASWYINREIERRGLKHDRTE